jgi:hypothetical protein
MRRELVLLSSPATWSCLRLQLIYAPFRPASVIRWLCRIHPVEILSKHMTYCPPYISSTLATRRRISYAEPGMGDMLMVLEFWSCALMGALRSIEHYSRMRNPGNVRTAWLYPPLPVPSRSLNTIRWSWSPRRLFSALLPSSIAMGC